MDSSGRIPNASTPEFCAKLMLKDPPSVAAMTHPFAVSLRRFGTWPFIICFRMCTASCTIWKPSTHRRRGARRRQGEGTASEGDLQKRVRKCFAFYFFLQTMHQERDTTHRKDPHHPEHVLAKTISDHSGLFKSLQRPFQTNGSRLQEPFIQLTS